MGKDNFRLISQNRRASHNYFIEYTLETGIVLSGTEIKSIRQGNVNLKDSYADIQRGEVILHGMHISSYEKGNRYNVDPVRDRKLLLHRSEINKLIGYIKQKGMALFPTRIYVKGKYVKVEIGVGKGKKLYDKRDSIAKKDSDREIRRRLKEGLR